MQQHPFLQPLSNEEDEDKPKFFFGAAAQAQLVDPIEGDEHFEDLPSLVKELSAELKKEAKAFGKIARLMELQGGGNGSISQFTEFRAEERGVPLVNSSGHIEALGSDEIPQTMQTVMRPEHSSTISVSEASKGASRKRARQTVAVAKPPITSREHYAGLKCIPRHGYEKLSIPIEGSETYETHFQCLFHKPDGTICNLSFTKSTTLIHHYMRHTNVRLFTCETCGYRFTQSGTLSRHINQMHKPKDAPIFRIQKRQRDSADKKSVDQE